MTSQDSHDARRRWRLPRFSLRLLFVIIALSSCMGAWVGHQLNWIRQRRDAREDDLVRPLLESTVSLLGAPYMQAPWPLELFGVEPAGVPILYVRDTATDEELARVRGLFPETEVFRWNE